MESKRSITRKNKLLDLYKSIKNEKELYENEFTYEEYLRQVELGYIDSELLKSLGIKPVKDAPSVNTGAQSGNSSIGSSDANELTVYITNTGSKYHRDGRRYLRQSKHAISKSNAQARGYDACSVCRP